MSCWRDEPPIGHRHTHVHEYVGGMRMFTHRHLYPVDAEDSLASRPHRHLRGLPHHNPEGRHSHPHGHEAYR